MVLVPGALLYLSAQQDVRFLSVCHRLRPIYACSRNGIGLESKKESRYSLALRKQSTRQRNKYTLLFNTSISLLPVHIRLQSSIATLHPIPTTELSSACAGAL
jgi:hypothetical protein